MEKQPFSKLAVTSFVLNLLPLLAILFSYFTQRYYSYYRPFSILSFFHNFAIIFGGILFFLSPIVVIAAIILVLNSSTQNKLRKTAGEKPLRGTTLAWVGVPIGVIGAVLALTMMVLIGLASIS